MNLPCEPATRPSDGELIYSWNEKQSGSQVAQFVSFDIALKGMHLQSF
jgi:hypothetical protein